MLVYKPEQRVFKGKKRKSGKVLPAGGMSDREEAEQRAGSDVTGGRRKKHPKKDIKGGKRGFQNSSRPSGRPLNQRLIKERFC